MKLIAIFLPILIFNLQIFAIDAHICKPEYNYLLPSPSPNLKNRRELMKLLPKNAKVIELGVFWGDFSHVILAEAKPKMLYLIDCWENQPRSVYNNSIADKSDHNQLFNHVKRHFAHLPNVKIVKRYSHEAVDLFEDESIDWIYIDANHCYEAVYQDLRMWYPKIKKGGYICGHDYFIKKGFGVNQAVNEFLEEYGLKLTYLTTQEKKDVQSFAIQKK